MDQSFLMPWWLIESIDNQIPHTAELHTSQSWTPLDIVFVIAITLFVFLHMIYVHMENKNKNKNKMTFSAHVLTDKARAIVLSKFPAKFPDVIAHHVTIEFGLPRTSPKPLPSIVTVVGHIEDESLEALVVHLNGESVRPDGKLYHITLSLDRSKGRSPVDSNKVLSTKKYKACEPFEIETVPALLY